MRSTPLIGRSNINRPVTADGPVVWFENLRKDDVPRVGGKNASLGEMVSNLAARGVVVPPGFATTADDYWKFVDANGLQQGIAAPLAQYKTGKISLAEAGQAIRRTFLHGEWPEDIAQAIRAAYQELSNRSGKTDTDIAVRSSATAEDLPDASFAG